MKILPTIGPETIKTNNLKYILSQTNFVRINSSHNSISWHKKAIKKIKKIKPESIILIDFPGIKPRTKNNNEIIVKKNEVILFSYKKKINKKSILITKPLPKIYKKKNL